jgi:hypothetical protein
MGRSMSVISSITSGFESFQSVGCSDAVAALHRHIGYVTVHDGNRRMRVVGKFKPDAIADLAGYLGAEEHFIPVNGLLVPDRRQRNVGWLNSLYADFDFHDGPLPDAREIELVINRLERVLIENWLPKPSAIVRSGRGFWTHWFLREPSSDRSVAATLGATERWARAAKSLKRWLAAQGFPVDGSVGENREGLTRLPDSINAKSGTRVLYTINYGGGGSLLYTLDEIEAAFPALAVAEEPAREEYASYTEYEVAAVPQDRVAGRRAGWDALVARRKNDIRQLVALRGDSVKAGTRHCHAVILAALLSGKSDRQGVVVRFGKNMCDPPMTDAEIRRAVARAQRIRKLKNVTIGRWLKITPGENTWLAGDYVTARPARAACKNQRLVREARREKISLHLLGNESRSTRAIARALGLSRGAVIRDLAALDHRHSPIALPVHTNAKRSTHCREEIKTGA